LEKIPFIFLSAVSSIITFLVQRNSEAVVTLTVFPLKLRIYNALISYVEYIEKMFWPSRLAVFYPHPGLNVSFFYAVLSAGFLLAVTIVILRLAQNHKYLAAGWFWFLGTLVPVIGFVQVGAQAMADRYNYIPLTGLFIIIAWGMPQLMRRKIVLWPASLIVLSILAVCSYYQLQYWKDSISLCQHAINVTKDNYMAHTSMTRKLIEQGRIDDAIRHNTEALRIYPGYIEALNNLGIAYYKAGRIDDAIGCYKKALQENPRHISIYPNLGAALAAKGEFDQAVSLYNKALQIAPDRADIHLNLGVALVSTGKLEEAAKEYQQVLRLQPQNFLAHNDLGIIFSRQGRLDDAIAHFNQAIQINPNYSIARDNLNIALAEKQKLQSEKKGPAN
jgi:protein O-mannosyl-transferase